MFYYVFLEDEFLKIHRNKNLYSKYILSYCLYCYNDFTYVNIILKQFIYSSKVAKLYLPEFILRLYLHPSVFCSNCKFLEEIEDLDNVEIHNVFYKGMIDRFRIFRFLPFFDEKVELTISKDIDSLLTSLECRNIELFKESKADMYQIRFEHEPEYSEINKILDYYNIPEKNYLRKLFNLQEKIQYGYSYWTTIAKVLFFQKEGNFLAGFIGFKRIFIYSDLIRVLSEIEEKLKSLSYEQRRIINYLCCNFSLDETILLGLSKPMKKFEIFKEFKLDLEIPKTFCETDRLIKSLDFQKPYKIINFRGFYLSVKVLSNIKCEFSKDEVKTEILLLKY